MGIFPTGQPVPRGTADTTRYFRVTGAETVTVALTETGRLEWPVDAGSMGPVRWVVESMVSLLGTGDWSRWTSVISTSGTARVHAISFSPPDGMRLIPGGLFTMGDVYGDGVRNEEFPTREVEVDAFYISVTPITSSQWREVFIWATNNGYTFANSGSAKEASHPIHTITWQDAVKWCNARSEMEGRAAAYHYMQTGALHVYRTGLRHLTNAHVNWNSGYRLPTEAEWEKAARGGAEGLRYPWGNTISHAIANYRSEVFNASIGDVSHDGLPAKYHPVYETSPTPYTAPVTAFPPNGYGLYSMGHNMGEYCWDFFATNFYSYGETSNPRGPNAGAPFTTHRAIRGTSWGLPASQARVAYRYRQSPDIGNAHLSFRVVLPAD
jgi:formylglycine-generating enzyme required for sulfatase activity